MIDIAEKRIQPGRIGTGPALDAGVGKAFERHRTVDISLDVLKQHPGLGLSFVRPALKSPVIRNRRLAAQVLGAWGRIDGRQPPMTPSRLRLNPMDLASMSWPRAIVGPEGQRCAGRDREAGC
jgi:hypothetical protein